MSQNPSDESPDVDSVFPFIIISLTEDRGQTHLCQILIANIFEQGIRPCKAGFPEIKVKRQIVDHYIRGICNLTQQWANSADNSPKPKTSEVSSLDALYNLKDTVNKNHPVHDQLYFSDSEATSHSSKQGKED